MTRKDINNLLLDRSLKVFESNNVDFITLTRKHNKKIFHIHFTAP